MTLVSTGKPGVGGESSCEHGSVLLEGAVAARVPPQLQEPHGDGASSSHLSRSCCAR